MDLADLTAFFEDDPPEGRTPWVDGAEPAPEVGVVDADPTWAATARGVIDRIRPALGSAALAVEHVGSTAVPGLAAKPVVDLDLIVPDPDAEQQYVPALTADGWVLVVREPRWYGPRLLRLGAPRVNLHVFGPDGPEAARHLLLRDFLRARPEERDAYAEAKRAASTAAAATGEHAEQYNARRSNAVRAMYGRAFAAVGLQR